MFYKKFLIYISIIFFLFVTTFTNITIAQDELSDWNKSWSYRNEIILPIDTSLSGVKYQPIDIRVEFGNPCWAKDEIEHSVRVVCWSNHEWYELESQIYDLEKTQNNVIQSCSIVFLVPDFADGTEKYYVYYDDKQKQSPNYPDRVKIGEEHYFYEPLPGQNVNVDYYKINDEEDCVYGVGLSGKMMTEYASNMIFRQKPGNKEFNVQNWDQMVGFCFQYDNKKGDVITTRHELVSNEIFTDGNLMVHFGIESTNEQKTAKTTNFYKYYHNPSDSKRICVDTKSEISSNIKIDNGIERDGTFVFLSSFKTRSESNIAMNMGEILPYFHVYSENKEILEYHVETNPKAREEQKIIAVKDDIDLGENSWFSTDNGKQGKSHGIIFSSNTNILQSGTSEKDGMQIKGYEKEEASLPGLKAYSAGIYCGRNSYEKQQQWDLQVPSDLKIEFRGEFFTTETQGYELIDAEAQLYRQLIKYRPMFDGTVNEREEKELHKLTVYVPFSLSMPFLSTVSPIPIPITWVELCQNQTLISSGITSRSLLGMRIEFPEVSVGDCLIKVYKRLGDRSEFVGFKEIEFKKDTKITVFCRREVQFSIDVFDQNNEELKDVKTVLQSNGQIILEKNTNSNGNAILKLPAGRSYLLQIMYKGLIVHEDEISLLFSKNFKYTLELFDLKVKLKDSLGLSPGVEIIPTLTSNEMKTQFKITPDEISEDKFIFTDLPSSTYLIQILYEGFIEEKQHKIPGDGETVDITFSTKFLLFTKLFDARGGVLQNVKIIIERENKKLQSNANYDGVATIDLPPGTYTLSVYGDDTLIQETKIEILRESKIYLLTELEPIYPLIIIVFSIFIFIAGIVLLIFKKIKLANLFKIICIAIVFLAIVQPWWELNGKSDQTGVERFSKTYLIPQTIVTTTTSDDFVEAEPANIPKEFSDFLFAVLMITCLSVIFIFTSMFAKNHLRIYLGFSILSILLLILTVVIFSYAFSELAKVGLGNLQGSKTLNIVKPGTSEYIDISASWGLSGGVYLCIIAIVILITVMFFERKSSKLKDKV